MVGFDTVLNKGQRAKAQKYQIALLFVENLRHEARANKGDNWLTALYRACFFSGLYNNSPTCTPLHIHHCHLHIQLHQTYHHNHQNTFNLAQSLTFLHTFKFKNHSILNHFLQAHTSHHHIFNSTQYPYHVPGV